MRELKQRFGRLVAANRKRAGMTQDALAEAAGVSRDLVARVEAGSSGASFTTIANLAQALEIDPAELFTPELAAGARQRVALTNVTARLSGLSDRDLAWVASVLDAVLKGR